MAEHQDPPPVFVSVASTRFKCTVGHAWPETRWPSQLQAKKAKDARAYGALLRLQNVRENSEEWKEAWKFFYS
jgi:hypothetical protein